MTGPAPRPFRLAPYFHPTTFCIVDDNERFLRSLELEMPPRLSFRAFSSTEPALEYVNEPIELRPLVDRCFSYERGESGRSVIRFDRGLIEQEISNPDRFRRLSVALVDFAMPGPTPISFAA